MSQRAGVALLWVAVLAAACTEDRHSHESEVAEREHAEPAHAEAPGGDASLVRIDESMLRDLRVTTRPAESRPAGDTVTVLGELHVNEEAYAEVGSPIPARVARVLAAPGDEVAPQQPLVELSSPEVGKARAAVRSAEAQRERARLAFERRRTLAADQIVSERELEAARAELAAAAAELDAARQTVEALGARRGEGPRFLLTSPIAGTVIERSALLGRQVDAERPLFIIGALGRLWLIVHAFERDALRVRTGASAQVFFPALPGESSSGVVARIGSRVDPASRTVAVRIDIDNPEGRLRPGMSATALLPLGDSTHSIVTVPVESLQRSGDGWCVFLPTSQPGVFEVRSVGRGRELGGEVEVLSGLEAGERVVADGAFLLKAEADKARGGGDDHHH